MRALDRYRILRPLGRGAAGGVFLVEDRIRGGSPVALKRIHARSDELLRASFQREFVVLASLALPGVARVLDFGLAEPEGDDPGGPFFTRTYVEGEPLDDASAGLSPAARVSLLRRVARVVAPLHRMGIAHGDLKPANVIVDGAGRPHVIDFGLARLPHDREARGGVGTPAFMAPELLKGKEPSVAADVYALGATLWALLTGAPPLAELGERATAERLGGKLPAIPDDAADVTRAALEVALRALDPEPARRLPTVGELAAGLAAATGDSEAADSTDGFVAPRPRGHEDVLAQLDARVAARLAGQAGEQAALLVRGPRGAGKSTLLAELKWRLQVYGTPVVEIAADAGAPLSPIGSLVSQATLLSGGTPSVDGEDGAANAAEATVERAVAAVLTLLRRGPAAVLVDDLDEAEPLIARALRMAAHADGASRLAVVATARDVDATAVRELGARHLADVPRLLDSDVDALAAAALGPVDASVKKALFEHTEGLPGALVDALAELSRRAAVTADDVRSLPPGDAGEASARARLRAVPDDARGVLETLAAASVPVPAEVLVSATEADEALVESIRETGLIRDSHAGLAIAQSAVREVLLDDLEREDVAARAGRVLAAAAEASLPAVAQARIAVAAENDAVIRELAEPAARELARASAPSAAIELLAALHGRLEGARKREVRLEMARLAHSVGRYDEAIAWSSETSADAGASAEERAEAAVVAGRSCISAGRFDEAQAVLGSVPEKASPKARALALRELAKVHLRRGDYESCERAVKEGLALAAADDPVRVELLTSAGMVATYADDHERARSRYNEALTLARARGEQRDEANVLGYLAIDHHRAGDHATARDLYGKSLGIARELGDVGSMATFALNLGAVCQDLGEPAAAAEHYEAAARLARRAGKGPTDVMARTNLASLHVYLGLYQRAKLEADGAQSDAEEAGQKPAAAHAVALLGDVACRTGDVEQALIRYDDAIARYRALGQRREVAEGLLDVAEALLARNGASDLSAAAARLADARKLVDDEKLEDFRPRLRLLLARVRGENGDEGAIAELESVLAEARKHGSRELEWQTLAALGRLNAIRGADFVARRNDQEAMEVLESIATRLPRDYRESFWHDPRRRDVRRRAGASGDMGTRPVTHETTAHGIVTAVENKTARLLELLKRLASEHDLDRLLERITDSAVELSGAERGFVLLLGADGRLEPRTVRTAGAQAHDPHVAFSQSIAEAVLIDGEPIVTVDARDDYRLSEYMSVHKLMLKSVACLPIRSPSGIVGALYLEHRVRRGRFNEADVDLLLAFADQAAIAVENARLLAENERRRHELEAKNRELEDAKAEIERVLVARTSELEDAKRELDRAREELRGGYHRHGIVGTSEAMRKVFAVVDRVLDTSVPVVIQGESGTGKELVARAVHYGGSRAKGPFVAVNCAAIPEALLESELFGHVKGAFTGADRDRRGVLSQASGGTLFLDEVGDMPMKMQVDLLRVLQDQKVRPVGAEQEEEVDVRVIAASNKSLADLVARGKFREDLFYRLDVVDIRLPPLRERPEDIPLLCDHFLGQFAERDGVPARRLSRDALKRLAEHPMPGNVRQLEHVLLNAWVLVEGEVIEADDLALDPDGSSVDRVAAERARRAMAAADGRPASVAAPQTYDDYKEEEKQRILNALEEAGWNRVRAAKAMGIPRRTFYRRLKEYGIL